MSQNIQQIYTNNPITSNSANDLFYVGKSPYGANNDAAIKYSDFSAQFVLPSSSPTFVDITLTGAHIKDVNGNNQLQFTPTASAVNYVTINNSATANPPNITATGSDTNIGIYLNAKGTGAVVLANENRLPILQAQGFASAVNNIQIQNATTTNGPSINAIGSDTNIAINFNTKGSGGFNFFANSALTVAMSGQASGVNYFTLQNSTAGFGPNLYASGSDTNININLIPQGSGVVFVNGGLTMASGTQVILAKANGTEAANAVTASGNAGVITTSSLSTAGGSSYAITWTNTKISSSSVINLTIMGGTNTTENITLKATAGSGTSTLTIYNNTAATALNGTILIGYTVL